MTLVVDDPYKSYPSQNAVWNRFMENFQTMMGLFFYTGVFAKYYYQALEEFYSDNVQYLEMRTVIPQVGFHS